MPDCTVEIEANGRMTFHHREGAFRRIVMTKEGYEVADGAEGVDMRLVGGGRREIAIGDDRYILPSDL